jgi:hypothetical protein
MKAAQTIKIVSTMRHSVAVVYWQCTCGTRSSGEWRNGLAGKADAKISGNHHLGTQHGIIR